MSRSSKQAVFGILFSEDKKKILLIQRRDIPVWVLPGGGIETGETAEEAVTREMLEETGLNVSIERQIAEYSPVNRLTQVTKVYECKKIAGMQQKGPETKDIQFFDVQNLPKLIPPTFPMWINDALSNQPNIIKKKVEGASLFVVLKSILFHPIISIRYFLTKIGIHINSKD